MNVKLVAELFSIQTEDLDEQIRLVNQRLLAADSGSSIYETEADRSEDVARFKILCKRRDDYEAGQVKARRDIAAPNHDDLVEEIVSSIYEKVADGTEYTGDLDDEIRIQADPVAMKITDCPQTMLRYVSENSYLLNMEHTFETKDAQDHLNWAIYLDLIESVNEHEDIIALKEKLEEEQSLKM